MSRLTLSHVEDDLEQNQSADFLRTESQHARLAERLRASASQHAHGRRCCGRRGSRRDSVRLRRTPPTPTYDHQVYVQDQVRCRPRTRAARARGTRTTKLSAAQATWNAEYGSTIGETRLFASPAPGFRAPDATDRFGFGGNPDLEPERSTNYEIGCASAIGEQQSALDHGVPQRHRRPDRVRRASIRHVRGREPQRRRRRASRASKPPGEYAARTGTRGPTRRSRIRATATTTAPAAPRAGEH